MSKGWIACAVIVLCTSQTGARTLEQDEARIDALIRAERAKASAAEGEGTTAPTVATVYAPAPSRSDEWLAPQAPKPGIAFGDLASRIGTSVIIVTSNQRVHRGIVSRANGRQVTLQVRRRGGNATYALDRDRIVRIEPL